MTSQVLCTGEISVSVVIASHRTDLVIQDGRDLRFECRTDMLRDVLRGSPMQVSSPGGFCLLETRDDKVRIEYGVAGEPRQTCEFLAKRLATLLEDCGV